MISRFAVRLAVATALACVSPVGIAPRAVAEEARPQAPAAAPGPNESAQERTAPAERNPRERRRAQLRQRAEEGARALDERRRTFSEKVVENWAQIAIGLLTLVLFWYLARLSTRVLRKVFERSGSDPALAQIAIPLTRISLLAIGLLAAVEQMGFNVGSLLAGVGIAGLAIGLAAQETLANLLAGIALLWDRPFRLGDSVTIGTTFGTVTEIGLRSTRLRTLEQLEVTIPNKLVAQQQILNHTWYPEIRINVPLAVGYGEDLERVRSVLLGSLTGSGALPEPPPQVVVVGLAETGVQLELRYWVKNPVADGASKFAVLELAKRALGEAGIEIPVLPRGFQLQTPTRFDRAVAPDNV